MGGGLCPVCVCVCVCVCERERERVCVYVCACGVCVCLIFSVYSYIIVSDGSIHVFELQQTY